MYEIYADKYFSIVKTKRNYFRQFKRSFLNSKKNSCFNN